jgi:hypothetical protein
MRGAVRDSVAAYLRPAEVVQAVVGAQGDAGVGRHVPACLVFIRPNRYRYLVVTSDRILVLDAGKTTFTRARGLVTELPRSTRLGPPAGVWHVIAAGSEELRVHRKFFGDIETADRAIGAA